MSSLSFPKANLAGGNTYLKGWRCRHLFRYSNATLQDLFDECQLTREAQAILSGNSGDFMAPPNELSLFAYTALLTGYNGGAYYPRKHFKFLTERLARFIQECEGCDVFYETEVTHLELTNEHITEAQTADGKRFSAKQFVCNMDPQKTAEMIGWEKIPKEYQASLRYTYSPSSFMIYHRKCMREFADHILHIVQKRFIPVLNRHIALKVVGTPTTNEEFCLAPFGNCYGSHMNPQQIGLQRLKSTSPWHNFFWCNASSVYAGISGATLTGIQLYTQLSGDLFYSHDHQPTTEEAMAYAKNLT